MTIKVLTPGLLTSIQDLGRYGYQKHGVIVSGAMDSYSLRLANLLVGNKEGEGVLEISLMGPSLLIEQDILLGITGGDLSPEINGEPIPMCKPVYVKRGSVLQFGVCRSGRCSYLAVAGGYDIAEVMGSISTYLRAGIGGFHGRTLKTGDVLDVKGPGEQARALMRKLAKNNSQRSFSPASWYIEKTHLSQKEECIKIRVMVASQFKAFNEESKKHFFEDSFQVTTQADRMGYRLSGPALQLAQPLEMISEAVALGTVQVPPDGNPIILLADRQSVGGYPKIAQVAVVDIPAVAQMKPGSRIRFQKISLEEAERLYLDREDIIRQFKRVINLKLSQ